MSNAKAKRKLRGYWIKKDIEGWINQKYKMGHYDVNTTNNSIIFNSDMATWNERFTHEETQLKQYENWNPYCLNCESTDRMDKTDYGWTCSKCGIKLGKHLYCIGNIKVTGTLLRFNKESGRPYITIEGSGTRGR